MNSQPPPYLRVLALNRRGTQVLARAKTTAALPLSHSLAQLQQSGDRAGWLAPLEARSVDLFHLLTPKVQPCGLDYTAGVVRTEYN